MKFKFQLYWSIFAIFILAMVPIVTQAASGSPFLGHWQAIDVDGSDIRLTIAGPPNGPFQITWTESYISFCGGEAGIVRGTGVLNESDPYLLEASLHVECFTTGESLDFDPVFRYHPATNTLSSRYDSGSVVIWQRPGQPQPAPLALNLRVNYGHDWVEGFYETGHMVWITVTESDGVTVKATAEMVTEPKDFWEGETGFQTNPEDWYPEPPDIQPYDWVYAWVDNGASAQVQIGDIQGEVFIFDDRIQGTILAPWITDPVSVECLDWGSGGGPFDRYAGTIYTNGSDTYACSWDPASEWDLGAWQDVGVGYFTPEGHWVANAFHAEHWMAFWTYDLPAGSWEEGEHSYYFLWAYSYPYPDGRAMDPQTMRISSSSEVYPGYVLIQPWSWMPQQAWTGSSCEVVDTVHPQQPTRFVWGWVNDFSMGYDEALEHFNSFTVQAFWDGEAGGSAMLTMGELMPFTGRDARFEQVCSLTEHPPQLDLRVNYGHDWVESFYEAGHKVWITVTEGDGVTVKATAEMVTEPKDFWDGETGFQTNPEDWDPAPPDIQPYDWVYAWVDNGASAQVQIGDIDGMIDLEADSIAGTISAAWFSDMVNVECHPWGSPEQAEMKFNSVMPDGSDPYSCSWEGEWDIQPYQDVGVGYFGPDGHWVANAFYVP